MKKLYGIEEGRCGVAVSLAVVGDVGVAGVAASEPDKEVAHFSIYRVRKEIRRGTLSRCVCGSRKWKKEVRGGLADPGGWEDGKARERQYGGARHIAHSLRTPHILKCINPL